LVPPWTTRRRGLHSRARDRPGAGSTTVRSCDRGRRGRRQAVARKPGGRATATRRSQVVDPRARVASRGAGRSDALLDERAASTLDVCPSSETSSEIPEGSGITQPPSRCPTGTPSAPAKCSSATKPVSGTAAAIRLGRAVHAIRRCTGRRSTNTARALQGPASRVCVSADLQQIVHRSPISAKRLPSRFLGNDPPHHSDSHDDDSQHGKQVA
jgi:hypothetical protein